MLEELIKECDRMAEAAWKEYDAAKHPTDCRYEQGRARGIESVGQMLKAKLRQPITP